MCCRYYYDDETLRVAAENLKIYQNGGTVDSRDVGGTVDSRDVLPSEEAPVFLRHRGRAELARMKWGYPGVSGKGLLINTRSETVMDKPMFRQGFIHGRILIPTAGFYEWNQEKYKFRFFRTDGGVLYLAGISDFFGSQRRFSVLTTAPNGSMRPIHNRMPLILEEDQLEPWLYDQEAAKGFLTRVPVELEAVPDRQDRNPDPLKDAKEQYHQMSLFDL